MTLVGLVGAHKLHLQHTCPPPTYEIFTTTHVGNSCPWCVASCSCPCPPLLLTTLTRVPNNRNRLKIYQSWSVGSFCGLVGRCKCVCVSVCALSVCFGWVESHQTSHSSFGGGIFCKQPFLAQVVWMRNETVGCRKSGRNLTHVEVKKKKKKRTYNVIL